MDFDDWWEEKQYKYYFSEVKAIAFQAWQAAQEAERERTTAIMLKHLAQWNVPWSENVDKAVKEINELDT